MARGNFYSGISGLTEPDGYSSDSWNSQYTEHFDLIDKYVPNVYKPPESTVRVFSNNKEFLYPPYPRSPIISNYYCGVVIGLQSNGGKIHWTSMNTGGTTLFLPFASQTIKTSHSEGGIVKNAIGYTAENGDVSVGWKNDRSISIQAEKYYKIVSIFVDNKQIEIPDNPTSFSYTFTNVRENHTIHANFERLKTSIIYNRNAPSEDNKTKIETHNAGTDISISQNPFEYDSHQFIRWNTESDGSGITYQPDDILFIEVDDITLYAQWAQLVSVSFIDEDGTIYDTGQFPIGSTVTPPIPPSCIGYTFAGWNGQPSHTRSFRNISWIFPKRHDTNIVRYNTAQGRIHISGMDNIETCRHHVE